MKPAVKEVSPLAPLVDELGALEHLLLPYRAKLKRADALRAALREAYVDQAAAGHYQIDGVRYMALLGPKGSESIVDKTSLYNQVGSTIYCALSHVSLKALQAAAPAVAGSVVSVAMTGSRPLTVVPKAPADRPKKSRVQ